MNINLLKDKFMAKKSAKIVFIALVYFVYSVVLVYLFFSYVNIKGKTDKISSDYSQIKQNQENFNANFSEELFEDHLKVLEKQGLESKLLSIEAEAKNPPLEIPC